MSQYVIALCCCYEYRVHLLFSQTPAYSAHLNTDTANLFRLTFQTFEYQYFSWFVDQPLKLKHTKTVLYTKFNFETFDIIIRMFVKSSCIYNFILQFKQISQPLIKYETEELYKTINDRKENIFTKVGICLLKLISQIKY